jgi:hypothetical protein
MQPAHMPTGLDDDHRLCVLGSTRNDEGPSWRGRVACLVACLITVVPLQGYGGGPDRPSQGKNATAPQPLLEANKPVNWWFVFKFGAKSFPGCGGSSQTTCSFGGQPSDKNLGQQFVFASSENHTLKKGSACIGDTDSEPVGATFGNLYRGDYHYVVWNDQLYKDPPIPGCADSCSAPWGHSKGVLAWDDTGEGFIMQVTTPSWPGSGSAAAARDSEGNTLGCIGLTNNVLVSQNFFALRLNQDDVIQVLRALGNASVVTDPTNRQLVNNGGPQSVQDLVNDLGKKSRSNKVLRVQLSSGVGLLSKPSALHVPPWQLVSAELGQVPLRVASWWTSPAIDSTTASTPIDCWDPSLAKPGAVEIATSGSWQGTVFGLKGGPGPDFNHAKIGVSTGGDHHFVIFGDMNQQGVLSDTNCGRSQNGRGGLFFVIDDAPLAESVSKLIQGTSAPTADAVR